MTRKPPAKPVARVAIDPNDPRDALMWQMARVREYARLQDKGLSHDAAVQKANASAVGRVERLKARRDG